MGNRIYLHHVEPVPGQEVAGAVRAAAPGVAGPGAGGAKRGAMEVGNVGKVGPSSLVLNGSSQGDGQTLLLVRGQGVDVLADSQLFTVGGHGSKWLSWFRNAWAVG